MEHEQPRRGGIAVRAARGRARAIALATVLAIVATLAPSSSAHALGRASKSLRLRMRAAPETEAREEAPKGGAPKGEAPKTEAAPKPEAAPKTEAAPKPDAREPAPNDGDTETSAPTPDPDPPDPPPEPDPPRAYAGPTAVLDVPGREAPWTDPRGPAPEPAAPASEPSAPAPGASVTPSVPPPSSVREVAERVSVAVGLAPEAPGSKDEKALLSALEASVRASTDPTTDVRRLRPGVGAPHRICREQREDLVVMIGYVADRPEPVVLAHDCRLDRALSIRAADAAREPGLVAALWAEHLELLRAGARERRRLAVGPKARAGIISGVAIIVVGVAVGALIGSALRKETVVITVRPLP